MTLTSRDLVESNPPILGEKIGDYAKRIGCSSRQASKNARLTYQIVVINSRMYSEPEFCRKEILDYMSNHMNYANRRKIQLTEKNNLEKSVKNTKPINDEKLLDYYIRVTGNNYCRMTLAKFGELVAKYHEVEIIRYRNTYIIQLVSDYIQDFLNIIRED